MRALDIPRTLLAGLGVCLGLLFFSVPGRAGPLLPEAVPEPLAPWVDWVLHDDKTLACPFLYNQAERQCRWPARLEVTVEARKAAFSQEWVLYGENWALLPGNAQHWPQSVMVDGQPAVVAARDGVPGVFLRPGSYRVTGEFAWDKRPEFLPIPAISGLVGLTLDGERVNIPEVDEQGRLWLRRKGQAGDATAEENRLEVRVFRHVLDGVPLELSTRLELDIAGKPREEVLGPVMDAAHSIPLSLDSPLPARLEPDGRLRVQVRPGSWNLLLRARYQGPVSALAPPPAAQPWPEQEIWVFAAQNHLRIVEAGGAAAVDPQQTGLPAEWKHLPAYRLQAGDSLVLDEKRRGDPEPAPDQLSLHRQIWLDFDGGGYTVQDRISGGMTRGWRLDMGEPGTLGRVAVDGQDQFITRRPDGGVGVEVRQGQIRLEADSRIDQPLRELPAVGWRHDFQQVAATLHLPPGWRLWHATGADNVPDTWLKRWTLLDLFVVLITALAVAKLWRWRWGALALLALALTWHEVGAPHWVWLNILAAVALLRVLPGEGRLPRLALLYRNLALLALALIGLPFMVDQARRALFPQLEYPWRSVMPAAPQPNTDMGGEWAVQEEAKPAAPPYEQQAQIEPGLALQGMAPPPPAPSSVYRGKSERLRNLADGSGADQYAPLQKKQRLTQIDPKAQVQTGPGLPYWQWNQVHLSWSGPVQSDQTIELYLLSPQGNRLLGFLRVLLLGGLAAFLLYAAWGRSKPLDWLRRGPLPGGTVAAVLLVCLALPWDSRAGGIAPLENAPPALAEGGFPAAELLEELGERLRAPPDCVPYCAAIPRMHLELGAEQLRVFLEIHAESETAVPLPGQAQQWLPNQVWLDDQPARGLLRTQGGQLWLHVPAGIHQAQMAGPLPARASLQLALPLRPQQVTSKAQGWSVEGVHENGVADEQLQFTRETSEDRAPDELEIGSLPPFVSVERTLLLGLEWQVETTVRRLSPEGTAVVLEIPLLPGESVTSEKPRVENGKALINLSPWESALSWQSVFAKQDSLQLVAPDTHAWREVWKLDASAIWHVALEGIPVIHHQDTEGRWLPEWRPWPGESVTLRVTRPEGVEGQVLTIDRSLLSVSPGNRATDYTLELSLRSSRGGQHRVLLPEGAELQSVKINGASQPIRQEGRNVTLPVTPGRQNISLLFRQDSGIRTYTKTAPVDAGASSVNAQIELRVPENRWILFTGGPPLGPAVLFWGVLLIVLLVSLALGRVPLTPLKTWQWFLLGLVLSQFSLEAALLVTAWLLLLGWRQRIERAATPTWRFNLLQLALAGLTVAALALMVEAIREGLLGHPDMQIAGNGSSRHLLRWYQDRLGAALPEVWVVSLPILAYRLAMLAWALWLAFALLRWLRWGWDCFSAGGLWKPIQWRWRRGKNIQDTSA